MNPGPRRYRPAPPIGHGQGPNAAPGPLTLDQIKESARMQKPRPLGTRSDAGPALAILACLMGIGCCCGGAAVSVLWTVFG